MSKKLMGDMETVPVIEKALRYAAEAHRGMVRKAGNTPYILHPMEAAVIAGTMTEDADVIAAALLHDTIEDTNVTEADIRELFGDRIAGFVLSETEEKPLGVPACETWRRRKESSLEKLRNTDDLNVKILWLSDKLSNMRSFYRQFINEGDAMWNHYHQKDKGQHEWYYRTILQLIPELDATAAMQEYSFLFKQIFG